MYLKYTENDIEASIVVIWNVACFSYIEASNCSYLECGYMHMSVSYVLRRIVVIWNMACFSYIQRYSSPIPGSIKCLSGMYSAKKLPPTCSESGKKVTHNLAFNNTAHPSLSCSAVISFGYDVSKEEVMQNGKASQTDYCAHLGPDYATGNGLGPANGENDYEAVAEEFDPIKHHNTYCLLVNENVAAAGCNIDGASTSGSSKALCSWQLTLDAFDAFQSLGDGLNQAVQSESATSLYKELAEK